jgi:putative sterol carrier protein
VPRFPSEQWFRDFVDLINGSAEYAEAAGDWEEGDVALLIEAEPDKGVPTDVWALLDLWHGSCRGGGLVDEARGREAAFLIRAPYARWRDVVRGELEPVKAMMQGKLRVKGDLPAILRRIRAVNELVHLAGLIDTTFPDDA